MADSDSSEEFLPFQGCDEMPEDIAAPENPIPFTLVNSKPLDDTPFVAPYLPCPPEIVTVAIEFACVTPSDVLVDLGSGDGRIVFEACKRFGVSAIGVELDPYLAAFAREAAAKEGLAPPAKPSASFVEGDIFDIDLCALDPTPTVGVFYLLPKGLGMLRGALLAWLSAAEGRRVVTINYAIPSWIPLRATTVLPKSGIEIVLYYYTALSSQLGDEEAQGDSGQG